MDATRRHPHRVPRAHARAPEVQQCYVLAGEWDYLVMLVASSVAHYREVAERLFVDEGNVRRYETRLVFDVGQAWAGLADRAARRRVRPRRAARVISTHDPRRQRR